MADPTFQIKDLDEQDGFFVDGYTIAICPTIIAVFFKYNF